MYQITDLSNVPNVSNVFVRSLISVLISQPSDCFVSLAVDFIQIVPNERLHFTKSRPAICSLLSEIMTKHTPCLLLVPYNYTENVPLFIHHLQLECKKPRNIMD